MPGHWGWELYVFEPGPYGWGDGAQDVLEVELRHLSRLSVCALRLLLPVVKVFLDGWQAGACWGRVLCEHDEAFGVVLFQDRGCVVSEARSNACSYASCDTYSDSRAVVYADSYAGAGFLRKPGSGGGCRGNPGSEGGSWAVCGRGAD
jgi:hypothetical protein